MLTQRTKESLTINIENPPTVKTWVFVLEGSKDIFQEGRNKRLIKIVVKAVVDILYFYMKDSESKRYNQLPWLRKYNCSDEGLTLETSAFQFFTVVNLRFQLRC